MSEEDESRRRFAATIASFMSADPGLSLGRAVLVGALASQPGLRVTDVGQGLGAVDLVFEIEGRRFEVTLTEIEPKGAAN